MKFFSLVLTTLALALALCAFAMAGQMQRRLARMEVVTTRLQQEGDNHKRLLQELGYVVMMSTGHPVPGF